MSVSLVPSIGSSGTWVLETPFDSAISASLTYECVAIRRLTELRLLGIDPYEVYYKPKNISEEKYNQDLARNDVCMVSLKSASGQLTLVPTTYIKSFPNATGLKYTPVCLVVDVGSIPSSLNLNALKTDMADLVKGYIGIENVTIKSVAVGEDAMVTQADHNSMEAARLGRITVTKTLHTQVQELNSTIQSLVARNQELEAFILANHTP